MKNVWKWSLGLSFGLLVSAARADEIQWRPAGSQPAAQAADAPAALLGQPLPSTPSVGSARGDRSRQVIASTPLRPLPAAIRDANVRPAAFSDMTLAPPSVFARNDSPEAPRPMPSDSPSKTDEGTLLHPPTHLRAEPVPAPRDAIVVPPGTVIDGHPGGTIIEGHPGGTIIEGHPGGTIIEGHPGGTIIESHAEPGGCEEDAGCTACEESCGGGCSGWMHRNLGAWFDPCQEGGCSTHHFYLSGEYLLWRIKGEHLPPLVTIGSESDAVAGALGQPNTSVIFGGNNENGSIRSGARFTMGYWFDDDHTFGIEGSGFFLGQRSVNFSATSLGVPFIGRPFFDVLQGIQNAQEVSDMEGLSGKVTAQVDNRLWGAELNAMTNLCCNNWYHVDLLAGFRYLSLEDRLGIRENLLTIAPSQRGGETVPAGIGEQVGDQFGTGNQFYGGQVGAVFGLHFGRWGLDFKGKLALGSSHQTVGIGGATTMSDSSGMSQTFPGGLLAQSTNSGHFSRDMFAVAPELGITLSYQITDNIRAYAGYNFLYWSNVVRAGDQVDLNVNTNLLPPPLPLAGAARPAFAFKGTSFWAQGANFGLEFRY